MPYRKPTTFATYLKGIESKWKTLLQRKFDHIKHVDHDRPRYILSMFPYPSGRLHLGHVRIYTSADILARFSRQLAKNPDFGTDYETVINPMGFDSFGLPAENAARERGLNPATWTNSNIRTMKSQMDQLALQFDWREATSNPSFYRWTQDLFTKLMRDNLAYKSYAQVNWDPIDKTVLADEQVDDEGRSWRSGALVEKRNLRQWFIKVNSFTKAIYDAEDLSRETWQDILSIQRNWIGKPTGWLFYLPVHTTSQEETLVLFTQQPELLAHRSVEVVIGSDHWLETVFKISEKPYIRNPLTGSNIRIRISDDIESLPEGSKATIRVDGSFEQSDLLRDQVLLQARLRGYGGYYTSEKYRDWLVSRQRFWGTPIPAIKCDNCGSVPVNTESLPVELPVCPVGKQHDAEMTSDRPITPLEYLAPKEWLHTRCPSCGSLATRECETFDTLFDSSWYFLRYASKPTTTKPFDLEAVQPVQCYIGGKEHASMHLFYARFISHYLHSRGELPFREPFEKLLVQGVVKSQTYSINGRYIAQSEVELLETRDDLVLAYEKMSKSKGNGVDPDGLLAEYGIDATRLCLVSYANPRSERLWRTTEEEFKEVLTFMRRVVLSVMNYVDVVDELRSGRPMKIKELTKEDLSKSISEVKATRNDCCVNGIFYLQETNQFRQYISVLHVLVNKVRTSLTTSLVYTSEFAELLGTLLIMLSPVTPHLSEELWCHYSKCSINPLRTDQKARFNLALPIRDQPWPSYDRDHLLQVKIFDTVSDKTIETIRVNQDDFRTMTKDNIATLVENRLGGRGGQTSIVSVRKYEKLMAHVVINSKSEKHGKEHKIVKNSSPS